ncbi:MAG: hypothetical protein IKP95_07420 [Ruminococcus sp.]|nr:hypothetical protein [Ruminococcus sp.]
MSDSPKPRTIAELLDLCDRKQLPLRTMRFFIGEDYPEAKAFGIYQDADGDFVVYKNKADGSRAVRYKGPDEERAVGEIYQKLRSEIAQRKDTVNEPVLPINRAAPVKLHTGTASAAPVSRKRIIEGVLLIAMVAVLIVILVKKHNSNTPKRGYYRSNDSYYYYDNDDWYYYSGLAWDIIDDDEVGFDDYSDRYVSEYYDDGYNIGDFAQSDYYDGYYERSADAYDDDDDDDWFDDDDDDDWDWDFDFDDWDYGDTDWDTDW